MSRLSNSGVKPPAHIDPYVRILGEDGAIAFLLEFGGADMNFGVNPTGRSALVAFVGSDKAAQLIELKDHAITRVPIPKRWIATVMRAKGRSVTEIARRLHTTDVTVRRYLKTAGQISPKDPRQFNLDL